VGVRVVYQSFEGRYSDSPRAIYEALAGSGRHEHVWLAAAGHAFPAGVKTVEYGSGECRAALEAADVVIANTHTDVAWDKRDGTVYLQTWHGTPLKRIHWDVLWAPEGRLDRLQADVERWDLLVSPNADSTPLLERAFRYAGPVLESGYPRNDRLLAPDREAVRSRVRRELGLGHEVTVLYAPTWRDDAVFPEGGRAFSLGLDPEEFAARLGDTHRLLVRLHPLVADRAGGLGGACVRDVSRHPEVAELYLAADVLITDYSSAMFDFAITDKPILLHVHDREDFEQRLRGLYFDLDAIAPGPLLHTTEEVLDAVADPSEVARTHAARLAAFRRRFCHLDDGSATERVIRAVSGLAA
jgi:CDP-glycerol glycerophosphotransferase